MVTVSLVEQKSHVRCSVGIEVEVDRETISEDES
jgi:hypothetical protein